MSPSNGTHPGEQPANSATTIAGRTSTRTETARPSTSKPSSVRICSYTDRAEGQGGSYSLQRWLQQSPKDDPWTGVTRTGSRRSDGYDEQLSYTQQKGQGF